MANICVTPSCGRPSTLRCPTCLKLGITTSFFCSQECFKQFWKTHKAIHSVAGVNDLKADEVDDVFAGYCFTGSLRPSKKTAKRTLPLSIPRPDYAESGTPYSESKVKESHIIEQLDDEAIECMRVTSKYAREVLEEAIAAVRIGLSTDEIDRIVHEACVERECYPSPLNYFNFPKSCCTSINEVICHGIPDLRPLKDGDILNIDVTTYHRGFHGDVNETVFVGTPDERSIRLVISAYKCLAKSMDAVRPGVKYRDIGDVITKQANADGFSVVRTYSGHGVHRLFHCPPNVPHYSRNKAIGVIKPRHCFTIEPMINEGMWRDELWPDRWTAVTSDGLRSAQFEHTMLVRSPETNGTFDTPIEVLTRRHIKGEDSLSSNNSSLSPEDKMHYQCYGRPHFVDQLHQLGFDKWIVT